MPASSSFPSGHTASAFAFATAVTADLPLLSAPLFGLATVVGYSRVHTGVHYPTDVIAGGILGCSLATVVCDATLRIGPLPFGRLPGAADSCWFGRSVPPIEDVQEEQEHVERVQEDGCRQKRSGVDIAAPSQPLEVERRQARKDHQAGY